MRFRSPPIQVPGQFLSVRSMGTALEVYPVKFVNRWVSGILGAILIGGAGLSVIYGLLDTFVQVAKSGPVKFGEALILPLTIAFVFLFLGALAACNAFLNWDKSVVVYDRGLAYSDHRGVQTWNWDEVEKFYASITKHYQSGVYFGTSYRYVLQKVDGSKLKLDNKFERIDMLGRLISQKVAAPQYARLVESLNNGQSVQLGPLSVNLDRVSFGNRSYAWDKVERLVIRDGYLSLKVEMNSLLSAPRAPVSAIPNLEAFLAVANRALTVRGR